MQNIKRTNNYVSPSKTNPNGNFICPGTVLVTIPYMNDQNRCICWGVICDIYDFAATLYFCFKMAAVYLKMVDCSGLLFYGTGNFKTINTF